MNSFKVKILNQDSDISVLDYLMQCHVSKNKINIFNQENLIYINNQQESIFNNLFNGDILEIKINEQIDIKPIENNLEVVFEDEYYLIVNKPRKMLIHSDGSNKITLNNYVAGYFKEHHIRRRIRPCNRLDYETAGLVIYAKDDISKAYMDFLFSSHQITKKYYAICHNRFSKKEGEIDLPIARDRHNSKKMRISKTGKVSRTQYKVLENGYFSLVDVNILTGRTHQIRLHLSHINHPLIGDSLYGLGEACDLMLQSYFLNFNHPFTNEEILIKINIDSILLDYMEQKNGK